MLRQGHFGLTLLVLSLFGSVFGFGPDYSMIIIIVLGALVSSLPDIDLKSSMVHHRGITHTILFALIIGLFFGIIFGYASGLIWGIIGFLGGFSGIMLHLLGDVMTFHKFQPFYPFDKRFIAKGYFLACSRKANDRFLLAGCMTFAFYLFLSSGAFDSII